MCAWQKKMCSCLRCFSLGNLFKFALFASSFRYVFSFFLFSFGSIFLKCKCDMSFFSLFLFHSVCSLSTYSMRQDTNKKANNQALRFSFWAAAHVQLPQRKKRKFGVDFQLKKKILWVSMRYCYYMEIVSASDDAFDDNIVYRKT